MARLFTPVAVLAAGIVLLVVAAILFLVPADEYIFLPDRARPVAPFVTVRGERPDDDGGGIYYVAVDVRTASLLEKIFHGLHDGATFVPTSRVRAPGESEQQRRRGDLRAMAQSQEIAAAVALRELGYEVGFSPRGALIDGVVKNFPAEGKIRPKDLVVAIDGHPVTRPDELTTLLARHRPGDVVRLRVKRDGTAREVILRTRANPDAPDRPFIGVVIHPPKLRLPVPVHIDLGQVGGPSAGLAFALDVAEELGHDVDHGYKVAATGALNLDGSVEAVGGLKQKTIGAKRARVDVLLVPAGENTDEAKRYAGTLRVIPVNSFRQALRRLATLPPKAQQP